MDLSYGGQYETFRRETRRFLEEHAHLAPREFEFDRPKMRAWQELLIDRGYVGRGIPSDYGGCGGEPDILKSRIIAEEFARAQVPPGIGGQGIAFLLPALLELGSEELKRRFVAPTLRSEIIWCEGYSEPNAGSDLASLSTSAVLDGDEWVINGQKIWTSTAQFADWMFCLVRTEPDAPKHKGLSFLLFSMKSPGIRVRPLETMTGDSHFNEVFFTDVRVPKDQIVGQRGQGWHVANVVLHHERDDLGHPDATLTRLHALIDLLKRETVDGRRPIDNPVLRDRLMRIQGRMMALRFNDLRLLSARLHHKEQETALAAMVVKLQGTELRHELEELAIDALEELGTLYRDSPYLRNEGSWQFMYMFYLGLIIGGGTSQIQKNIISERGLGMPKEPKVAGKLNCQAQMEFALSKEQVLLQESVGRFLDRHAPLARVQRFANGDERRASDLWDGICDLGLPGMLVAESQGGIGLGLIDAALVAEMLGSRAAPVPFVATAGVVPWAIAQAGSEAQKSRWLPALAEGRVVAGAALGHAISTREGAGVRCQGAKLSGKSLFAIDFEADVYLVADERRGLHLVEADAAGLARHRLTTVDRTRAVGELVFDNVAAERLPGSDDPEVCARAIDAGRILLAADTFGAAQTMLQRAVAYAKQRVQFGRAIASFQAVKHMCAEMAAELEPCRAMMWYAAHAFDAIPEESRLIACHTKAHLSEVGTRVARTSTEVHGGIGFTDELGLHLWFKRIGVNRQLLGGPDRLRALAAALQQLA